MIRTVGAVPHCETHVVPGTGEGGRGLEVLGEPVHLPLVPPEVTVGGVQEHSEGTLRLLREETRVGVAVGHLGEARVERDDFPEYVRAGPGSGEGRVATGTSPADTPLSRIVCERMHLGDKG